MRIFDLDITKLAKMLLPTFWRKPRIIALVTILTMPLADLYSQFLDYKKATEYKMSFTPQVCQLERLLNDKYDNIQRRIYIENPVPVAIDYLYYKIENKPIYLYRKSDNKPNFIYRQNTYNDVNSDFTITIPLELQGLNEVELRALVNYYKLFSKTYTVRYE